MAAKKTASKGAAKSGGSKKRLTQTEIVNHLAEKSGMKRAAAKEFMNELLCLDLASSFFPKERRAKDATRRPVNRLKFQPKQPLNSESVKE
jgi:hypothetical protein